MLRAFKTYIISTPICASFIYFRSGKGVRFALIGHVAERQGSHGRVEGALGEHRSSTG
jgi:hypothetical protein